MHHKYKIIPQAIMQRNIITFQAWADSHANFPYIEPLLFEESLDSTFQ